MPRAFGYRDAMSQAGPEDVRTANRRFYDKIAAVYEEVDSRRGNKVDHSWLDRVLADAATLLSAAGRPASGLEFVDAGAGSGFLAQHARRHFSRITLLDISKPMLDRIDLPRARKVQGECDLLPFRAASVDFVGAFATLHHLHSPEFLFREAARVLRPGGIFYSDHDIERSFVSRFRLPLRLYRALCDHGHGYLERCPDASHEDYELSEFHGEAGLDIDSLASQLQDAGLRVVVRESHWEGMGAAGRIVSGLGLAGLLKGRGWAPVARLVAVKP
jgi:SAM-dependent methyltransferase